MNDDECDLHQRNPFLGEARAARHGGCEQGTDLPRLPSAATHSQEGSLGVLVLEQSIERRLHPVSWGLGCGYSSSAGRKVLAVIGPLLVIDPLSLGFAALIVVLPIIELAVLARM